MSPDSLVEKFQLTRDAKANEEWCGCVLGIV